MNKRTCTYIVILAIFLLSCNFVAAGDVNSTELGASDSDSDIIEVSSADEEIPLELDTNNTQTETGNMAEPDTNSSELTAQAVEADANSTEPDCATGAMESSEMNIVESANAPDDALKLDNANAPIKTANEKTNTVFSLKANHLKTKDTMTIFLKDENGFRVKNKAFTVTIYKRQYNLKTNSKGYAKLKISIPSGVYKVRMVFNGDDQYKAANNAYSVSLAKIPTSIGSYKNVILNGYSIFSQLKDPHSFLAKKNVQYILNGKTFYRTTKQKGETNLKIKLKTTRYNIIIKFTGDNYYKASSKNFKFYALNKDSFSIGNDKLITNGYLRVYLKDLPASLCSDQELQINVGDKEFNIKTDAEGIVVLKPEAKRGNHLVTAKFGTYTISKNIHCYNGDPKDPLYESIALYKGRPDIDVMQWYFVMANEDATYTLSESQYKETLWLDSCSLQMFNELPKYTLFKSQGNPDYYHIIKREKWNAIERELNTRLVKKNEYSYWPDSITVSLKGKSYTYPVVRDIQNTEYTCGPTSASVCSQALKKFYSEKYFQVNGNVYSGINIPDLKDVLEDNGFDTSYFYDMDTGVSELKEGGCALIAFLPNHYVSVIDVSEDGNKILVSNSYGAYDVGGDTRIPTGWVYLSTFKAKFQGIGLVVQPDRYMDGGDRNKVSNFHSSMGPGWKAHNTNERIPDVGL